MLNLISAVTGLFGFSGLGTFFPKYIEYHFRQKPSDSGLTSLYSSAGTGLGIFLGGFLITKFRFKAKTLAAWSMFIGLVAVLALISLGFIACPRLEVTSDHPPSLSHISVSRSRTPTLPVSSTADVRHQSSSQLVPQTERLSSSRPARLAAGPRGR